jgi:hydrogenase maturation protein HypF
LAVLRRQLERGTYCVPTSSMGRLFDAVSSLLGVRHVVSYEAQAAIEMETAAAAFLGTARDYRFATVRTDSVPNRSRRAEFDPAPVLRGIVDDVRNGVPSGVIAAGFHVAVARLVVDCAERVRDDTGLGQVALSGGVFQNVLLVRLAREYLTARGFEVLTHRLVPPNDGGLALGQVAIAAHRGKAPRQGE